MKRLRRGIVIVAVVGLVALFIYLAATPGSVVTQKNADGALSNRDAMGGLIALLVLGCVALGLGFEDWL